MTHFQSPWQPGRGENNGIFEQNSINADNLSLQMSGISPVKLISDTAQWAVPIRDSTKIYPELIYR